MVNGEYHADMYKQKLTEDFYMAENHTENVAEKKPWPDGCLWPDPERRCLFRDDEDMAHLRVDSKGEELLEIRKYFDGLVKTGKLDETYKGTDESETGDSWKPEKGAEYWNGRFDFDRWKRDMAAHLSLLKLPAPSPVPDIQRVIDYEFINENLVRQAFTRRAFGIEHHVGDSEILELFGDAVVYTVAAQEIASQLTGIDHGRPDAPFRSVYNEGELTRLRQHYICKDYMSGRAEALGLDKYILYGSQEQVTESSREDVIEALIGAVAVDCDWNWHILNSVVGHLLAIRITDPGSLLEPSWYDTFNSWHQRKFGKVPDYEVRKVEPNPDGSSGDTYLCTLRYAVPQNDRGIPAEQRTDARSETKGGARELAARNAYSFVADNGLWMNLREAGIEPRLEDAVNQLQELVQKKYLETAPEYTFEEKQDEWFCCCTCSGISGQGCAPVKKTAKKQAAFMVLTRLMSDSGGQENTAAV